MVRYLTAALAIVTLFGFAFNVDAVVNKGAAQISIDGGNRGTVPFPHHQHQDRLEDCMVCHQAFAQEKGSIEKAKTEGRLVPKQVMTDLCIQCHREQKRAGKPAGPTSCSKCHIRDK